MKNIKQIEAYFSEIKDEINYADIEIVETLSNKEKAKLYDYLKNNDVLYAGGEINERDVEKVRNVLMNLWVRSTENNKKYRKNNV